MPVNAALWQLGLVWRNKKNVLGILKYRWDKGTCTVYLFQFWPERLRFIFKKWKMEDDLTIFKMEDDLQNYNRLNILQGLGLVQASTTERWP